MEAILDDLKLFEDYAKRVRTNLKRLEDSMQSEIASDDASNAQPIASNGLPNASKPPSDEVTLPSDSNPPKPLEVPPRPLEEKPTVFASTAPSETASMSSDDVPRTASEHICSKCQNALKPKRVRKPKSKKQLEASRRNLSLRWTRDRKKLEATSEEKPVLVLEDKDKDELELLAPRKMVGRHVAPPSPPPPAQSPFDNAF